MALMGQAGTKQKPLKVVEAEQFVLIDETGKMRATLNIASGMAGLAFFDKGNVRLAAGRKSRRPNPVAWGGR